MVGLADGLLAVFSDPASTTRHESTFFNAMVGTIFKPSIKCEAPAAFCDFKNFTTMGICAKYEDTSALIIPKCTAMKYFTGAGGFEGDTYAHRTCTYSFPRMKEELNITSDIGFNMTYSFENTTAPHPKIERGTDMFLSATKWTDRDNNTDSRMMYMFTINVTSDVADANSIPVTKTTMTTFGLCEKEYNLSSVELTGVTENLSRWNYLNATHSGDPLTEVLPELLSLISQVTGNQYTMKYTTIKDLFDHYQPFFANYVRQPLRGNLEAPDLFNMSRYLYQSDIQNVSENIAQALTNAMRSNVPGDNNNATTYLGTAYFLDVYVQVRWPWLILPLVEALLCAALLATTIISNRRALLLKTSIAALQVYPLQGWSHEEIDVPLPVNIEKLEKRSQQLIASFGENNEGRLKFIRS
jgi:hypothetical protein